MILKVCLYEVVDLSLHLFLVHYIMNLFSSFVTIMHIVAYCIVFFFNFLTIAIYFAVAINNEK